MADGVTVCHSVTLIPIPHVMVIIHHNLWFYGFSSLIAGITFCRNIMSICQHANVSLLSCHSIAIKSALVLMQMSPFSVLLS